MKRIIIVLLLIAAFSIPGCLKMIGPDYDNTPVGNFDYIWDEIDHKYSLFEIKGIDWRSEYDSRRGKVYNSMSDDELWNMMTDLLSVLNDNHVYLLRPDHEIYRAGSLYMKPAFSDSDFYRYNADLNVFYSLIKEKYLAGILQYSSGNDIFCGRIAPEFADGKKMGYIYLYITTEDIENTFKDAVISLNDCDGLILDLRFHKGGEDYVAGHIASNFAAEEKLFMTTRAKQGPAHNDFEKPRSFYLDPGKRKFEGPVIVLQNQHTHSGGEILLMALKHIEAALSIGETSSGAFSNTLWRQLPNGWLFSLSSFLTQDADGTCHEGKGILPDIEASNTLADINLGTDTVLDEAIDLLNDK